MQYVPAVSDQDVERVVRRDYPAESHSLFRIDRLPVMEIERMIEEDKSQYLTWLDADGSA